MKGKYCVFWLCVLLFMLAIPAWSANGELFGQVTDAATGALVEGVSVSLGAAPAITDSTGHYSFAAIAEGIYTATTTKDGYYPGTIQVTITAGTPAVVNIQIVAIPPPSPVIYDNFDRTGPALGSTDDRGPQYPWSGDASISGNQLALGASAGSIAVLDAAFRPADFDMTFDTYKNTGGTWTGVFYRGAQSSSFYPNSYLLYWMPSGDMYLSEWFVGSNLASVAHPGIDWNVKHTIRLRVEGTHQEVWFDGHKDIDLRSGLSVAGGYIGFQRSGTEALIDNLSIGVINTPTGTVSGTIRDAANPAIGLANAKIKPGDGDDVLTDADGNYSITCRADAPITLNVRCNDYYPGAVTVQPLPGQTVNADVSLTHLPTPAAADVVTDHFQRTAGTDLGTTEAPNAYPWLRGYSETTATSSLSGTSLQLAGGVPTGGVGLGGGFLPADLDISVDASFTGVGWAAVTYRQSAPGTFDLGGGQSLADNGYLVFADGATLNLWRAGWLAEVSLPVDWSVAHNIRVRAVGPHHQVWVDNVLKIDLLDWGKLAGGYVGCHRAGAAATFDNVIITRYTGDSGQISGTVSDAGNPISRIAGAKILLNTGQAATTDINGQYSFSRLPNGTYTVMGSADNYLTRVYGNVVLSSGSNTVTQDIKLLGASNAGTIVDNFNRADSDSLGSTSGALELPWDKGAETYTAVISDGHLSMQALPVHGISLGGGFLPADLDMSIEMSIWGGTWGGLAYRQSLPGVFDLVGGQTLEQAGYLVWATGDGTNIHLWRNGYLASASFETPIDWVSPHTLRVKAVGPHHEVYLDDVKVIDCYDTGKLSGGYAGVLRDNAELYCDNFSLSYYQPEATTVTGTVTDAADPSIKITNASVHLSDGQTIQVNQNGVYLASIRSAGSFDIGALAPGYAGTTLRGIEAAPGPTMVRDIALTRLPANSGVFDTFTRADSTDLGTTEDSGSHLWLKRPDAQSNLDQTTISSQGLRLGTIAYDSGVSLDGFYPDDFELVVDATVQTATPATEWWGISYRGAAVGDWRGAYAFLWLANGTFVLSRPDFAYAAVVTPDPLIDWSVKHKMKVRVVGPRHQLFVDDRPIIDVIDWTRVDGGFIGFTRTQSPYVLDNLSIVSGAAINPIAVSDVAHAKAQAPGTMVSLSSAVVSGAFDGFFYVEQPGRYSGIKIVSSDAVAEGDTVTVQGWVGSAYGEQFISGNTVTVGAPTDKITPLGLPNRSFAAPIGLSDIGLLVKAWGEVKSVDAEHMLFVIDDGSGTPITVLAASGTTLPGEGAYVGCTGVARMQNASMPVLQMRSSSDLAP